MAQKKKQLHHETAVQRAHPQLYGNPKERGSQRKLYGKLGLEKQRLGRCRAKQGMFGIQHGAALNEKSLPSATGTGQFRPNHCHRSPLIRCKFMEKLALEAETNSKISVTNSSCTTVRFPVVSENPKIARLATLLVLMEVSPRFRYFRLDVCNGLQLPQGWAPHSAFTMRH